MSTGKLPKTYLEQLQILKNRGLGVTDEAGALHILEHHNYYRLSAYRFPLTEHDNPDRFLPGLRLMTCGRCIASTAGCASW